MFEDKIKELGTLRNNVKKDEVKVIDILIKQVKDLDVELGFSDITKRNKSERRIKYILALVVRKSLSAEGAIMEIERLTSVDVLNKKDRSFINGRFDVIKSKIMNQMYIEGLVSEDMKHLGIALNLMLQRSGKYPYLLTYMYNVMFNNIIPVEKGLLTQNQKLHLLQYANDTNNRNLINKIL